MGKLIYTFIMVMGFSTTVAMADDKVVENIDWAQTLTYAPVELDRLPASVQEVLALGFPCLIVNSVECKWFNEQNVIYKVVLSDPENMETTLFITESGEILE